MGTSLRMSTRYPLPESCRPAWTRRGFMWAGISLPFVAGCSSDPNSDSAGVLSIFRESLGGPDSISREQASRVPYASVGVRVGDSAQTLLVLATKARETCLWTSASHIAVETQSGRITRTAGLAHNMSQTLNGGNDFLRSGTAYGSATCEYAVDIPDRNVYQAPVRYEMKVASRDETIVLGGKLEVTHILEHGSCPLLDWEFENEYWLGLKSGFAWRSRQVVHPDLDPIEIVVFRPPA